MGIPAIVASHLYHCINSLTGLPIKDSNLIQNERNTNQCACQTAFPTGLSVQPQLYIGGQQVCRHFQIQGTPWGTEGCGSHWSWITVDFVSQVWTSQRPVTWERGGVLDALLVTRSHRPLALWLQLGKDRREHGWPSGLRQEATPSPHGPPEAWPSENDTRHSSPGCGSEG